MRVEPRRWALFALAVALPWVGCVRPTPVAPPVVVHPPPPVLPVVGVWENAGPGGANRKMIFEPGGRLTFQGGLDFYNPGQWDYDPGVHELRITLPQASDDKLQIFKMYVGDGVKAFDRERKVVTYTFDDDTQELNIGGWMYTKHGSTSAAPVAAPEPVLH